MISPSAVSVSAASRPTVHTDIKICNHSKFREDRKKKGKPGISRISECSGNLQSFEFSESSGNLDCPSN